MANLANEPGWLVKDFDVLYRAARVLVAELNGDLMDERNLLGRETTRALGDLELQLRRLAPAHHDIQLMKASHMPRVANQGDIPTSYGQDRAMGKGD